MPTELTFEPKIKKKRSSAFTRSWIKNKKNKRKFRGKVRLVRINKPYNWRSNKTLVTKHRIKQLTRLWTKTQHRIYRDLRNEFWTQVAWYFDKKKRRKFWVQWRLHKELKQLGHRVRFPNKYKSRWPRKNKNKWKKDQKWNARIPNWQLAATPGAKHKQKPRVQIQPPVAQKTKKWLKKDQISK